jgi:hypothetical protein
MTAKCLELFVDQNLSKYGSETFEKVKDIIMETSELYEIFHASVQDNMSLMTHLQENIATEKNEELFESTVQTVYKKVVKLFLLVMFNQFRKDLLEAFNIKKKMAHRKQVQVSNKSKKENKSSTSQSQPTQGQSTTSHLPEPMPSTSKENPKGKGKRKRNALNLDIESDSDSEVSPEPLLHMAPNSPVIGTSDPDEDNATCKVCYSSSGQTDWIQCDSCHGWFHRKCAGLQHHLRWKKFQRKGVDFHCKQCE